jgi:hypothetical protein
VKPIFDRHGEVAAALQRLESGEQARLWGVPVSRLDHALWRINGGAKLLLLAAIDCLMRAAGFAPLVEIEGEVTCETCH